MRDEELFKAVTEKLIEMHANRFEWDYKEKIDKSNYPAEKALFKAVQLHCDLDFLNCQ